MGRRSSPLVLGLTLLLAACGVTVPDEATGPEIYDLVCARCHASDLGGGVGPALGAGSEAAAKADDAYIQTITRGRGRMPAFGSSLTDAQIDLVIDYLREQQGG